VTTTVDGVRRVRQRSRLRFLRDLLIIFLVAIFASFMIKTFLVRSFWIPSGSMENTLQINDRVIVDELVPSVVPLQRGDVVVFTDPGGWLQGDNLSAAPAASPVAGAMNDALTFIGLSSDDSDNHLIKRVIGLPGDHVSCCNAKGQTSVDGVPLAEPYTAQTPLIAAQKPISFKVTVPSGAVWVEGDNRYDSADSRFHLDSSTHGFVPESDIVGRAILITWPIGHWTWLSNYQNVFTDAQRRSDLRAAGRTQIHADN
jgi:signal peptidase I